MDSVAAHSLAVKLEWIVRGAPKAHQYQLNLFAKAANNYTDARLAEQALEFERERGELTLGKKLKIGSAVAAGIIAALVGGYFVGSVQER